MDFLFHLSISLQVQQFDALTARLSTLHIATILTELAAALDWQVINGMCVREMQQLKVLHTEKGNMEPKNRIRKEAIVLGGDAAAL